MLSSNEKDLVLALISEKLTELKRIYLTDYTETRKKETLKEILIYEKLYEKVVKL